MRSGIIILTFLLSTGIFKSQYNENLYKKALSEVYQNPDNALKMGQQMLKNEKDPDNIIKLYKLMSHSYISKRDYDKSLDWVLKMKEFSKTLTNPEQKIKILNAIAIQYQQMGLYSNTIDVLDDAFKKCSQLPESRFKSYYLGLNYAIRGLVYKNQNNNELALEKLLTGLDYLNKIGDYENSIANKSIFLYNIGYCYFYLSRYNEAENYFKKSADVAKSIQAESLEAFAYKGLSETFTVLGENNQAITLLKKADQLSIKVHDLVLSEGIYKGFADNYLAQHNWELYEVYNKRYNETKFAREQSELASVNKSIDVLNAENNKKIEDQQDRLIMICIVMTIISALLITYFVIKFISNKKRNLTLLKKLNQINTTAP